jgi:hypothetical protein
VFLFVGFSPDCLSPRVWGICFVCALCFVGWLMLAVLKALPCTLCFLRLTSHPLRPERYRILHLTNGVSRSSCYPPSIDEGTRPPSYHHPPSDRIGYGSDDGENGLMGEDWAPLFTFGSSDESTSSSPRIRLQRTLSCTPEGVR